MHANPQNEADGHLFVVCDGHGTQGTAVSQFVTAQVRSRSCGAVFEGETQIDDQVVDYIHDVTIWQSVM